MRSVVQHLLAACSLARTLLGMDERELVAAARARYGHLAGRHTHQWHRFVVTAPSLRAASGLAAQLGWWLHCWDLDLDAAATEVSIVENPPPPGGWVLDPIDVDPSILYRN